MYKNVNDEIKVTNQNEKKRMQKIQMYMKVKKIQMQNIF